jgi:hypothetical protein
MAVQRVAYTDHWILMAVFIACSLMLLVAVQTIRSILARRRRVQCNEGRVESDLSRCRVLLSHSVYGNCQDCCAGVRRAALSLSAAPRLVQSLPAPHGASRLSFVSLWCRLFRLCRLRRSLGSPCVPTCVSRTPPRTRTTTPFRLRSAVAPAPVSLSSVFARSASPLSLRCCALLSSRSASRTRRCRIS